MFKSTTEVRESTIESWIGGLQYRARAMIAIVALLGDDSKVSIQVSIIELWIGGLQYRTWVMITIAAKLGDDSKVIILFPRQGHKDVE